MTTGSTGQRLTAEYVIARVLLDATSIEAAAAPILQAIAESFGWEHGELWTVDRERGCLRCVQMWSSSHSQLVELRAMSNGVTFALGAGLPGRVWATAGPIWIQNIAADAEFVRAAVATRDGLHSAFGFPVLLHGEVVAVMDFLGREDRPPDEQRLPMLTAFADQIGMFIERHRAQTELTRFFTLSPDMLAIAGFDGFLKRINPAWQNMLGYTEQELLARPYIDLVHPDDVDATRAAAEKVAAGGSLSFENRLRHRDGTTRWMLWEACPFMEQQLVYAAARDITEQKTAEELRARTTRLELVEELLATLVDTGDIRDMFGRISEIARKVLPHDGLGLPVMTPDGRHARRYASVGLEIVLAPELLVIPDSFLRPDWDYELVDDVTLESEPVNRYAERLGFRSALRIPIRFNGKFVALLAFLSYTPSAFKQSDVLVARRITDRLAVALSRDRELAAVRQADEATVRASKLEARVRALTDELDARTGFRRVVGESLQWRHVLTQAAQVAATDTTVLLLGESGTGKEVVARFLHRGSPRKNGPFIALNCAALPEQLLEAELFGYERGAFTGATQSKPGQLEQAAGGMLFLDEVAEMSPSAQAKFLRVLQEREFQRLGGTRVLRTDARIVAATNRDLKRAIANGQFREDLYYRLNVFAIRLPPLRDRREDILPLCDAFLVEIGRGLGTPPAGISRDARELLTGYSWPGNVRELRNILERASILCDGGLITSEHIALNAPRPATARHVSGPALSDSDSAVMDAPTPPVPSGDLSSMERAMIQQALQTARFNKSKAAKALGLTRHQLYIRMRKYGFE